MANWISVEDRMPESIGLYICFINGKVSILAYNKEIFQSEYVWNNMVTHWMPLPEPPDGE